MITVLAGGVGAAKFLEGLAGVVPRPAAIIRHFQWRPEPGKASALIRPREKDLFR